MLYQTSKYDKQIYKVCRHCKMQIPVRTKTCPYCYRSQLEAGEIIFRIIGAVVSLFLLLLLFEGMDNGSETGSIFFLAIGGTLLFLGFPISIITSIIRVLKRKPLKKILISVAVCFFGSLVCLGIGGSMSPDEETVEQETQLDAEQPTDKQSEQDVVVQEEVKTKEDSEKSKVEKEQSDREQAEKEQAEKEKAEREKAEREKAEREERINTFEYADIKIKYLKSEITYNSIDEKCLYVYFKMTNNSDENQAFRYLVTCKAFQNGVELDTNYIYDCDEEENGSKEIQPGATITVAEVFELDDSTENVTIEVRPFNIWSDKLLFEKEIRIAE